MFKNGFNVRVVKGVEDSDGYVKMSHGQVYKLTLHNRNDTRCDARVEIDGKEVGTWRLNAYTPITLERPADDTGQFTFYKLGTAEGQQVGLTDDQMLGLIKVTFMPERKREPVCDLVGAVRGGRSDIMFGGAESLTMGGGATRSAGGTGLSGRSSQQFHTVANLDYDPLRQVVINLRLVCRDSGPRPLVSVQETTVPPRIG